MRKRRRVEVREPCRHSIGVRFDFELRENNLDCLNRSQMGILCDGLCDAVGLRAIVVMGVVSWGVGVGRFGDKAIVIRRPGGLRRLRMPTKFRRSLDVNGAVIMAMNLSRWRLSVPLRAKLVLSRACESRCPRRDLSCRLRELKIGKKMMHAVRRGRRQKKNEQRNGSDGAARARTLINLFHGVAIYIYAEHLRIKSNQRYLKFRYLSDYRIGKKMTRAKAQSSPSSEG